MVKTWIKQVAAAAPERRVDPWILPIGSRGEGGATFPRWALCQRRCSGIDHLRGELRASSERLFQVHPKLAFGIGITRRWHDLAVDGDGRNGVPGIEIQNQRADRCL